MENPQIISNVKEFFATHPSAESVTVSRDGFLFYRPEDAALHTGSIDLEVPKYATFTREEFAQIVALQDAGVLTTKEEPDKGGDAEEEPGKGVDGEEEPSKGSDTEQEPGKGGDTEEEPAKAGGAATEPGKTAETEEKPEGKPAAAQTTRRTSTRK